MNVSAMHRPRNDRTGRNDPCPCGSGKKHKHCCLGREGGLPPAWAAEHSEALERQRVKMQGHGRPIIAEEANGQRRVAVGSLVYSSERWKTFHDFLRFYLYELLLKGKWVETERKKPKTERHLLLNWVDEVDAYLKTGLTKPDGVGGLPMTALPAAVLGLAYNLYLISHNNGRVHRVLIQRLKQPGQFLGAYYEAFVTGAMIRAGFDIALENEKDGTTKHCEFTATYRATGQQYSVEAKMRHSQATPIRVTGLLAKALEKPALHPRIVFIEINAAHDSTGAAAKTVVQEVAAQVMGLEAGFTTEGQPAPPTYLFLTNQPPATTATPHTFAGATQGFRMPDFTPMTGELAEAIAWRARHRAILDLSESLEAHISVPSTFDGTLPEVAFANIDDSRLLVGRRFKVPNENGDEEEGELISGAVMADRQCAMCVFKMDSGANIIVECPLSDVEMKAYRASPETFFGIITGPSGSVEHPFKFFDRIYESYRGNSKEHFLEKLMQDAPDIEHLRTLSQDELARVFAERTTRAMMQQTGHPPGPLAQEKGCIRLP